MSDLTKYRDDFAEALRSAGVEIGYVGGQTFRTHVTDRLLASPVLARIIADAKAEVASAIEALHYDAPAAKTAQATAVRIARGGAL